ncbi:MAG: tagaturonate reductase [Ginsengibacter sp.]
MKLSRDTIPLVSPLHAKIPGENIFDFPERVLQFGTGVLLRGLPGFLIDQANRKGIFKGRIVAVKSTMQGTVEPFVKQDGLYTVCIRGPEKGKMVEENIISASISRALSANEQWPEVLECAHNPLLRIIISNTTETGIEMITENFIDLPPVSFPGKLMSFLYERFKIFGKRNEGDVLVIPTELITDNGEKLRTIVFQLATDNNLPATFTGWLEDHVHFCSSLVDRIVPGKPEQNEMHAFEKQLGYSDELLTVAEPYHLWVIEGDEQVRKILSFAEVDSNVIITANIGRYRELKLRLLNGSHTMSCGLAFLSGFDSVYHAMKEKWFYAFVRGLMLSEIATSIPFDLNDEEIHDFAYQVLERFTNPFIRHLWLNISMNYTSKLKIRNVPVLLKYYEKHKSVPGYMALGFAAYILFMRPVMQENDKFFGQNGDEKYLINDPHAAYYFHLWKNRKDHEVVTEVLGNRDLWEEDLLMLPGFSVAVIELLTLMKQNGIPSVMSRYS